MPAGFPQPAISFPAPPIEGNSPRHPVTDRGGASDRCCTQVWVQAPRLADREWLLPGCAWAQVWTTASQVGVEQALRRWMVWVMMA
jgi:hypothetical protein